MLSLKDNIREINTRKFCQLAMAEQPMDRKRAKNSFVALGQQDNGEKCQKFEKEYPADSKIPTTAIKWYTDQSFFFKLLNAIIRGSDDPFTLFYVQLAFKDVFESVKELYEQQELIKEKEELHLYRSTYLSQEEIEFFKNNTGDVIELLGFISTAKNKVSCRNFEGNAILEIIVEDKGSRDKDLDYGYADITALS